MSAVLKANFGALLTGSVLIWAASAAADQTLHFYERDAARTIFGKEAALQIPGQNEDEETPAGAVPDPAAIDPLAEVPPASESKLKKALLEKYGDPNAEQPINVVDNAPKPFKAMMEALDGGEDEMAMLYARQYVRYLQKLQRISGRVVSMTGQVMKGEGLAEGTEWEHAPSFVEDEALASKLLSGELERVDTRGAELLKQAQQIERQYAKSLGQPGAEYLPEPDPSGIAPQLAGKIPVDPKGQVNVYLFVDPVYPPDMSRVKALEGVGRKFTSDPRVAITIASSRTLGAADLSALRKQLGTKLRVVDGSSLASKLGVEHAHGSVVLLAPNAHKAVFEEKRFEPEYLSTVVRAMQGTKL